MNIDLEYVELLVAPSWLPQDATWGSTWPG